MGARPGLEKRDDMERTAGRDIGIKRDSDTYGRSYEQRGKTMLKNKRTRERERKR